MREVGKEAKHEIAWCKFVRANMVARGGMPLGSFRQVLWPRYRVRFLHTSHLAGSLNCLALATACVAMEALEKFCDVLIHRRRLLNRIWIHWINWINSGSGYPPRKRSKGWSKRNQRFDEGLCYSQGLCWAFGSSLEFVVAHLLWDWWTTASSLAVRQEVWSRVAGTVMISHWTVGKLLLLFYSSWVSVLTVTLEWNKPFDSVVCLPTGQLNSVKELHTSDSLRNFGAAHSALVFRDASNQSEVYLWACEGHTNLWCSAVDWVCHGIFTSEHQDRRIATFKSR